MATVIQQGSRGALSFEQLTVTNAIQQLTVSKFSQQFSGGVRNPGASGALITVESADIRVQFDPSQTVSATNGHLVTSGSSLVVDGTENLRNLRFFRNAGADAKISVTYWS